MQASAQHSASDRPHGPAALFSFERLLLAAAGGSTASFVFLVAGAINPGPPASDILEQARIPFFEHQLAATFVLGLVWLGAGRLVPSVRKWPWWPLAVIVFTTLGAGIVQWFFPNY
jgi:hypothetical protein